MCKSEECCFLQCGKNKDDVSNYVVVQSIRMQMCNNPDVMNKSESKGSRMLQAMQAHEVAVHDEEEVEVLRGQSEHDDDASSQ